MAESLPPEGQQRQPLTRAQICQLRRELSEQVLDRALSDPDFKGQLLDDPELAMREANFPAAQELAQQGAPSEAEVTGSSMATAGAPAVVVMVVLLVLPMGGAASDMLGTRF